MYDSMGFYLQHQDATNCISFLSDSFDYVKRETGEIISNGKLENLRVKINSNHFSIQGSLAKYYFGTNIETLTRKDTRFAIEKLSDSLHLPLNESKVYRLDVGANIITKETPLNYFSCLGILARFKRTEHSNRSSLLYTTNSKSLSFYDKIRDAKRTKSLIPDMLKDSILLRYELHLTDKIPANLSIPELKAEDITKEGIYTKAIDLWKKLYFNIQRVNRLKFNKEILEMTNAKWIEKHLALIGLKQLGEMEVIKMIDNSRESLNKMQVSRLKKKIIELMKLPELTEPNESIKELDSKINQIANNYR